MKRFSFLQVVVLAALLVTVASCGAPMYSEGGYDETPSRANVYYGDPYFGGVNTVIVERDPYTGRYYQVSPGLYGSGVYSAPAYPYYGRRYSNNNRYYNNSRNYNTSRDYNTNRSYNPRSNNGYYRTYPQQRQQAQQAPVQRQQVQQQQRNEAKDAILGKKRN